MCVCVCVHSIFLLRSQAEEGYEEAKKLYTEMNRKLHEDLPKFHDRYVCTYSVLCAHLTLQPQSVVCIAERQLAAVYR